MKVQVLAAPAVHHPSPTGLVVLWLEVLELAHAGQDDLLAERLARLSMTADDLDAVFGPGAGSRLWPEYARAYGSFTGAGAREIAAKIRERRYDDVEVIPCPACEGDRAGTHVTQAAATAAAEKLLPLRCNAPVYSVRLKRADEVDGIRIDTFVYVEGGWRTALKVGRKVGQSA